MEMDRSSLRKVFIDGDAERGVVFFSNASEPIVEGEYVMYKPLGADKEEATLVLGRVGKVYRKQAPYMALGEGKTYQEKASNLHLVCLCWAEIAWSEQPVRGALFSAVAGGPQDWLPGLEDDA